MNSDIPPIILAQAEEPVTGDDDIGEALAEEIQGEVGAHPDPHGPGMPQLNASDFPPQLVWLAITFVALYLLMSRVALPRIATVLENRRDRIASDLDAAARLKQDTDEAIAAYEQELAQARAKAHQIGSDTREKLNASLAEERGRIDAELAEKTTEAEKRVAESKDRALAEIDAAAADAASDIVTALIGIKPSAAEALEAVKTIRQA